MHRVHTGMNTLREIRVAREMAGVGRVAARVYRECTPGDCDRIAELTDRQPYRDRTVTGVPR